MRLAVFTTRYPGGTFFRRDMSALRAAGIDLDVFPIYPLPANHRQNGHDSLCQDALARDRVHDIGIGQTLRHLPWPPRKVGTLVHDAVAVGRSAAPFGAMPLAKSAYVLSKAWGWAAQHGDECDHVLAYWGNYAGTCAYAFHRLINRPIPFSIWLHAGTDLYLRQIYLRQKILYADNVVTCCEFNRQFMHDLYPDIAHLLAHKIHVNYHGLDLESLPYSPDERPAGRVIAVGRLSKYKGFAYLLRAVQVLRRRAVEVEVELVGDGPESRALKALAAELGIMDRVIFRGWLKFADVREAMSRATILVHPSDRLGDGLPNVIREAMAVGTPVIASRVAGIPEALDGGRCGTLVPPKDVDALAKAIETLLNDEVMRRRYAILARRRTEELFDLSRTGPRLAERLRSITRMRD